MLEPAFSERLVKANVNFSVFNGKITMVNFSLASPLLYF